MSEETRAMAKSGKLTPEALVRSVFGNMGVKRDEVLIGPAVGEDAAVIEWPKDKLMVFASDPIVGATVGAGRLLVRVNVNDIASKGGEPAYMVVTLVLPPSMGEEGISRIMGEIHEESCVSGVAIVGGHTELNGRYSHPVLSAALIGMADRVFKASDVKEGDFIFVSKHIGIEGMAILASDRPDLLRSALSEDELSEVRSWMNETSVLAESRILRKYASFMHDPTEGGFFGGLDEICRLAGLGADIDIASVPLHSYTRRASEVLGFNPLRLVASGSMIAVIPPERAESAVCALAEACITMTNVGRMTRAGAACCADAPCGPAEELWGLLNRK